MFVTSMWMDQVAFDLLPDSINLVRLDVVVHGYNGYAMVCKNNHKYYQTRK
jgi:hypothetical protein